MLQNPFAVAAVRHSYRRTPLETECGEMPPQPVRQFLSEDLRPELYSLARRSLRCENRCSPRTCF